MALDRLGTKRRGDPITAEWANQVKALLEGLKNVRTGPGLEAVITAAGLVISQARRYKDHFALAVVLVASGADPDDLPTNVRYTVQELFKPDATIVDKVPDYGRPIDAARVKKAPVGSLAFIARLPDGSGAIQATFGVFAEKHASAECEEEPDPGLQEERSAEWFNRLVVAVADEIEKRKAKEQVGGSG